MVIVTAKLNKIRIAGVFVAAAAVVLLVILLANRGGDQETAARRKLETPESRVEFLASCGYTVSPDPARVQEVRIPDCLPAETSFTNETPSGLLKQELKKLNRLAPF